MNPKPNPSPSRATELWKRFVGIFGGEAVGRKFGDAPPPEWLSMIDRLKDFELERGMRRLVYGGRDQVPSLPAFVKLCRTIGTDEGVDDGPKPLALPNPDGFTGDEWDIEANHHFLALVMRRVLARQPAFDETQTRVFIGFKKAWARDMREGNVDPATGEIKPPSIEEQKAAWADCMQRAEAAILQKAAA